MLLRLPAARAVLLLSGFVPVVAMAGEAPTPVATLTAEDLNQVTIVGTLEESLPQQLASVGSRVESISGEQVQKGGYYDIAQTLQALAPGMYITPLSGAFDYVEVSFLGSRNSEMVWLVDGIRLNNRLYSTTMPLDTIPAHLVERIELIEGGQSLFFGTQAVAGAVNIVTPQFSAEPAGRVRVGVDSNNGRHANGLFSTAAGDHRFVLFASKDKADGFNPFSDADRQPSSTDRERGYDVTNFGLKYAYDFGDAVRTSFGYQHTDATLDYVRPFSIAKASNDRKEDLLTAKVDISSGDHLDFYLKGYYHDWDTLYNEIDSDGEGGTEVISDDEFWGFEDYGANLLARYAPGGMLEYYAGWDYQHYSGEDQVFLIAPLAETVHAPFAQVRTSREFSDRVRFSLGARHNNPGHGRSATVWTATSHWDITDALFTRASLGTAFRLPDAYELFVVDPCCEQGNPDLKPERSKYLNLSIGGRRGTAEQGFGWELVGFFRDVKGLIDIVTGAGGIDTLANTEGKTKVRGAELILSGHLSSGLSANASFTVTDANLAGSRLQQQEIPKTLAKLAVGYDPMNSPWFAGLTVSHTGDVYRSAASVRRNYGNYTVVDVNGGLKFGGDGRHRIGVRLENAFDEEYASRVRTGETDGGDSYAYSFRGTPRTVHASYTYSF
jgi:outer membrane cobalamin receptor